MRHRQIGRKLGVDSSHRDALLRTLTLSLIEHEAIKTTKARAKEVRWFADRVVTLAKRGDIHGRRHMVKLLGSTETQHTGENRVRNAVEKVYNTLVPRFKARPGGYTQILHLLDRRAGDNSEMVLMRYLPSEDDDKKKATKGKKADSADKLKKETKLAAPEDKPAKAKPAKKAEAKADKKAPKEKA